MSAAAVAVANWRTAREAQAADGDPVLVGVPRTGTNTTSITTGTTTAIQGNSTSGAGLIGASTSNVGVYGQSGTPGQGGVFGFNTGGGFGVVGNSPSGIGLIGFTNNNIAVAGAGGTGTGVFGTTNSAGGFGAAGINLPGIGVRAVSETNIGCYASSVSGIGVVGQSNSSVGVYGASQSGLAGQFDGSVRINGNFEATGIKSAIVPLADGTEQRLYCLEAPENWFEDVGEATLVNGSVFVPFKSDFAAVVKTEDTYHVFLTPHGESGALSVTERNKEGFVVREAGGRSNVSFSYRVVVKRRDVDAPRSQRVRREDAPKPRDIRSDSLPSVPRPPQAPSIPGGGGAARGCGRD